MQPQHFIGNIAQKAIIEVDGKVLVCRGKGDDIWELPGGRLHAGESPQEGLAREIKEELRVDVIVGAPVCVMRSFHIRDKQEQVFIAYSCALSNDAAIQPDNTEIEEVQWVPLEKLHSIQLFDDCTQALGVYTGRR